MIFDNEDEGCKIAHKLEDVHEWAHACLKALDKQDLKEAHALGHKILDILNEAPSINAVKFLAIFEVLSVGVDVMEHDSEMLMKKNLGGTATIN